MIRLGLIGRKLGHSYSRRLFNERFAQLGIDGGYSLYEIESIDTIRELVRQHSLNGFNVTIPYKETILPYLDRIDPVARTVGAVNTVCVSADMTLTGYNTDIAGFSAMLTEAVGRHWHSSWLPAPRAIILGTGGAAKAAAYVLAGRGASVTVVSRYTYPHRWIEEAGHTQTTYTALTDDTLHRSDIIVNATPVGMYPHISSAPPVNYSAIPQSAIALDLIYNPSETLFLNLCRTRGACTANGMLMLEVQAGEAWRIWHDTLLRSHHG